MRPVFSVRIGLESPNYGTGRQTLILVPAGFTAVVRQLIVTSGLELLPNIQSTFEILEAESEVYQAVVYANSEPATGPTTWTWEGRIVLNPGDQFLYTNNGSDGNVVYAGGYLLTGVPPTL